MSALFREHPALATFLVGFAVMFIFCFLVALAQNNRD